MIFQVRRTRMRVTHSVVGREVKLLVRALTGNRGQTNVRAKASLRFKGVAQSNLWMCAARWFAQHVNEIAANEALASLSVTSMAIRILVAIVMCCVPCRLQAAATTQLGIRDYQFKINGEAKFLVGVSYYGALGSTEEKMLADLNDIQRHGFN